MADKKYSKYMRSDNIKSALSRHVEITKEYFTIYANKDLNKPLKFGNYYIGRKILFKRNEYGSLLCYFCLS